MTRLVLADLANWASADRALVTLLQLSLLTGKGVVVKNFNTQSIITTSNAGLRRKHLTIIELATAVGRANTEGLEVGATEFIFQPTGVFAGNYTFSVGTGGSALSLIECVALPLCVADNRSTLTVYGHTHGQDIEITYDIFNLMIMPLYATVGMNLNLHLHHPGYAPNGVGKVSLDVAGCQFLRRYQVQERGKIIAKRVSATIDGSDKVYALKVQNLLATQFSTDLDAIIIKPKETLNTLGETILVEIESELITQTFVTNLSNGSICAETITDLANDVTTYITCGATLSPKVTASVIPAMCAAGGGKFNCTELTFLEPKLIPLCELMCEVKLCYSQEGNGKTSVEIVEQGKAGYWEESRY